jgi:hypothetical protein
VKPELNLEKATRPKSAVSHGVGLCGLAGLFLWVVIARNFGSIAATLGFLSLPPRLDGPHSALMCLFFTALPMVLWSVLFDKVHLRASTGIDWSLKRPISDVIDTSIIKLGGLWATWALIAAIYATFRFWWGNQFADYPFAMKILQTAAIPLFVASIPYVVWLDRYMKDQRDGSWHFGAWIAGKRGWQAEEIFHHLRAWAVKGFFLAFMISITPGGFYDVVNADLVQLAHDPVALAGAAIGALFMVDVQFATLGYMLTLKPLDAHIRTANPYMIGWAAALICYPPLIQMNSGGPLDYHIANADWAFWLQWHPTLVAIWGAMLVALTTFYAWATVAFGLRFSNLTHRGILTHGPFTVTKHPAYLSKNIFWWLSAMPFLVTNGSMIDAARNTAILACVSGVYYWRAKTEEKHLLADPVYVQYSDWMAQHAPVPRIFGKLKRILGNRIKQSQALSQF